MRSKYLSCLAWALLLFGWSACNKIDLPEPDKETPTFELTGYVGSRPVSFGGSDHYLFTEQLRDEFGIRTFSNSFNPVDEDDTLASISLRLRDNRSTDCCADTSNLFNTGRYAYLYNSPGSTLGTVFVLRNELVDTAQEAYVSWSYIDVDTHYMTGSRFIINNFKSGEQGVKITAVMKDSGTGCNTQYIKSYNPGLSSQEISLRGFSVSGDTIIPQFLKQAGNLLYEWSDGVTQGRRVITTPGRYTLRITNSKPGIGVLVSMDIQRNSAGLIVPCLSAFTTTLDIYHNTPGPQMSTAEVRYTDRNGVVYTSATRQQKGFFEVEASSPYESTNQAGDKVRKATVLFNDLKVYAPSGDSLVLNKFRGVVGWSYR